MGFWNSLINVFATHCPKCKCREYKTLSRELIDQQISNERNVVGPEMTNQVFDSGRLICYDNIYYEIIKTYRKDTFKFSYQCQKCQTQFHSKDTKKTLVQEQKNVSDRKRILV